jgi:hypothetical protein
MPGPRRPQYSNTHVSIGADCQGSARRGEACFIKHHVKEHCQTNTEIIISQRTAWVGCLRKNLPKAPCSQPFLRFPAFTLSYPLFFLSSPRKRGSRGVSHARRFANGVSLHFGHGAARLWALDSLLRGNDGMETVRCGRRVSANVARCTRAQPPYGGAGRLTPLAKDGYDTPESLYGEFGWLNLIQAFDFTRTFPGGEHAQRQSAPCCRFQPSSP